MLTGNEDEHRARSHTQKALRTGKTWRGTPVSHAGLMSRIKGAMTAQAHSSHHVKHTSEAPSHVSGLGDTGIVALDQAIGSAGAGIDTLKTAMTLTAVASVVSAIATIGLIIRSRKA